MAESKPPVGGENLSAPIPEVNQTVKPAKPLAPPNPMWKYMGFGENFRPRVPSRNWLIFLSLTGSLVSAIIYDKREKNRAQRKWCKLVEHMAKEPLDSRAMPRTLTVFLEGPPSSGLRETQDHFKEFVKPILVASGLDWEFVQGRKEGDVRAEVAEKIRNQRLPPDQRTQDDPIATMRVSSGIKKFDGPQGDIILGRHTWKEYVRGLHEGWLGPLTEPQRPQENEPPVDSLEQTSENPIESLSGVTIDPSTVREISDVTPAEASSTPSAPSTDKDKPKKPPRPPPFISTVEYSAAAAPSSLPEEFDPSTPISFPHILGFLNTPKRFYRFLNRRKLADSIGRETAAIILSNYRPYHTSSVADEPTFAADQGEGDNKPSVPQLAEQQTALLKEEKEWHKSVRVRKEGEPERTWLEPMILDPRIAERMRRFELSAEDEARARTIVVPEEEIEGWIKGGIRRLGRSGKEYFFAQKQKTPAELIADEEF